MTRPRPSASQPRLDGVHQQPGDIDAEGGIQLTDTGRAGDVDFGQIVADDIEADEHQPLFPDHRGHPGTDLPVTLGQLPPLATTAGGQIAPVLALGRDPGQGVGHRLAIDQQDALVARRGFRE